MMAGDLMIGGEIFKKVAKVHKIQIHKMNVGAGRSLHRRFSFSAFSPSRRTVSKTVVVSLNFTSNLTSLEMKRLEKYGTVALFHSVFDDPTPQKYTYI